MFIAVSKNGNVIQKEDINSALLLKGKYYIFSINSTLAVGEEDGIIYYDKKKNRKPFKVESLELISAENSTGSSSVFCFSIYDSRDDSLNRLYCNNKYIYNALGFVVKSMFEAILLPDWQTYEKLKRIDSYKSEIEKLQKDIQLLKNQNEELLSNLKIAQEAHSKNANV